MPADAVQDEPVAHAAADEVAVPDTRYAEQQPQFRGVFDLPAEHGSEDACGAGRTRRPHRCMKKALLHRPLMPAGHRGPGRSAWNWPSPISTWAMPRPRVLLQGRRRR